MNLNISNLYHIAGKPARTIIGLMSGTSMDGLDIALCKINGSGASTTAEVLKFKTAGYTDTFRAEIKAVFSRRDADLQMVCLMHAKIALEHARLINDALKEWGIAHKAVDLIASHGQTIFHAPASLHQLKDFPNATLQIGDGDHIAVKTGIITISDFRQKHIAAGGEGAPLAVYGDYLIFSREGEERVLLNIGGISNFTYLPGNGRADALFSTDVGPGNTLMDQYCQQHFNLFYDRDAAIALSGKPNRLLLDELLKHPFFDAEFPKTTGPELFNLEYLAAAMQRAGTAQLTKADVMATLCHFSASAIANAVSKTFNGKVNGIKIFMSGGGMHNPLLNELLKEKLQGAEFYTTDALGIPPDAKEAVLFALLANECVAGGPLNFGKNGVPAVTMGKLSFPG